MHHVIEEAYSIAQHHFVYGIYYVNKVTAIRGIWDQNRAPVFREPRWLLFLVRAWCLKPQKMGVQDSTRNSL